MIQVCIFPFTNQWLPVPENCSPVDWLNKIPELPAELRSQFSENYDTDPLLFTKWFHYCQWRLSIVIDRNRAQIQAQILRELLPENWTFDHLRQYSAREGNKIQDSVARTHLDLVRKSLKTNFNMNFYF